MIPSASHRIQRLLPGLLALGLALCLAAPAAQAQLAKAFVASTGSDANGTGARNAPLRTFNAAQAAIGSGGEIVVLDTAGFGALTITKALTITVPNGINAFITVASGNGVTVAAGPNDVVSLNGLVIEGSDINNGIGILSTSVGVLRVQNCTVRTFGAGIFFNNTNVAHLVVGNSAVRDCNTGMEVDAPSTISSDAVVNDSLIDNITYTGLFCNVVNGDTNGTITVNRSTISHCALQGVYPQGFGSGIVLNLCSLNGNGRGALTSSSAVYSAGNNLFTNNGVNVTDNNGGGTLTAYPLQ